jgi:uncharacterized membrane protein
MRRNRWILWLAATLIVAAMVHMASLQALPRVMMARALARIGPSNVMHYSERPNASSRVVVRPNPDMLSAFCPFDLSKGPVKLTARVPHSTYWSVSAYDAATNNFFVRDDRQIAGDSIEVVVLRRGMRLPPLGGAPEQAILISPTERGLFLVRVLIDDDAHIAALQAIQHQAACGTVGTPGGSG